MLLGGVATAGSRQYVLFDMIPYSLQPVREFIAGDDILLCDCRRRIIKSKSEDQARQRITRTLAPAISDAAAGQSSMEIPCRQSCLCPSLDKHKCDSAEIQHSCDHLPIYT